MELNAAIAAFLEHLRVERGMAPHTLKAYGTDLENCWRYLSQDGKETLNLQDMAPLYLKDFIAHLRDDRQFRPSSIGRAMSSLRVFFAFCLRQGWITADPSISLRNPKAARKLPVYLVEDEIGDLIRKGIDPDSPSAPRDRAILVTFLFTGVRLSELVGLDWEALDFGANAARIMGKGSKERLIPLHAEVRAFLGALRELSSPARGPVFRDDKGGRMTARMVGYVVQKALRRAGLSHRITPHKLRHTFATQLLHRGANLLEIKELLGHSRIATTSIYTHTHVNRLRRAVDGIDS